MSRRLPPWAAPAVLFLWCLGWILAHHFPDLPPGNDSTFYLLMAKTFAAGEPWRDYSSPFPGTGMLQSPTLFPLLVAPFWFLPGGGLAALKIFIALLMASSVIPAYLWLRGFLPAAAAFLAMLAFGSHFLVVVQGNSVMTESVFTPLLYLGLLLSARGLAGGKGDLESRALWPAAAAWVMVARTRVVGWAFLAVFGWLLLRRREWLKASVAAAAAGTWVLLESAAAAGVRVHQYGHDMFTEIFPVKHDFWRGIRMILANLGENLYDYATAIHAHLLLPWLYGLAPMTAGKRGLCLAVFFWSLAGAALLWKEKPALRPWLSAVLAVNAPTLVFFEANDAFRYLVPYHAFLMLAFLYPFTRLPLPTPRWSLVVPAAAALLLAVNQGLHTVVHAVDQEGYFLEWRDDFIAVHRDLPRGDSLPDYFLSPDPWYSHLVTGVPAFHNHGRHRFDQVAAVIPGHETWCVCGPRNAWDCEDWARRGLRFEHPPVDSVGMWSVWRVTLDSAAARQRRGR